MRQSLIWRQPSWRALEWNRIAGMQGVAVFSFCDLIGSTALSQKLDPEDMREINLAVRVGIATGLVVVGDLIGEGASQESAVVGDTPKLAARLQDLAQANTFVVSSATLRLTTGRFLFNQLGVHSLKGIELPADVYQVLEESRQESRFDASINADLTPLIGREEEIASLQRRWAQAQKTAAKSIRHFNPVTNI